MPIVMSQMSVNWCRSWRRMVATPLTRGSIKCLGHLTPILFAYASLFAWRDGVCTPPSGARTIHWACPEDFVLETSPPSPNCFTLGNLCCRASESSSVFDRIAPYWEHYIVVFHLFYLPNVSPLAHSNQPWGVLRRLIQEIPRKLPPIFFIIGSNKRKSA